MTVKRNWFGIAAGLFLAWAIAMSVMDGMKSGDFGSGSSSAGNLLGTVVLWGVIGAGVLVFFKWVLPAIRNSRIAKVPEHDAHHQALMEQQRQIDEVRWEVQQQIDAARAQAQREGAAEVARVRERIEAMQNRWV